MITHLQFSPISPQYCVCADPVQSSEIIIKQLRLELSGYNWFCLVGQTLSQSRYRLDTTKVEIVQTDRQTYGWMDTRQRMEGHKTLDGGIYRWCMDGGGMVVGWWMESD